MVSAKLARILRILFLLAIFTPTLGVADSSVREQHRQWIEEMKTNQRGPFSQIRWFCNDGTLQPPKAYACAKRGGGHQHGEWSERTQKLRVKGYKIAKDALKNGKKYSSYVAFGICTWLSMQFSVNVAMNIGLIPPKGFTLPLISYGGSSMIFVLISLAILLRIDMENRCKDKKKKQYV